MTNSPAVLKFIYALFLTLTLSFAACATDRTKDKSAQKPQIIFDTDFGGDADDLGAIAMLHFYADQERIDLLAITSWSHEKYAMSALAAVNNYYGRPDLPLGVRDVPVWRTEWNYSEAIVNQFPSEVDQEKEEAVGLYRKILHGADTHSVSIVTVGPLANIQNLLRSKPDDISPLSGEDLFEQKVKEVIIMGGRFPSSQEEEGPEWNFDGNMPGVTQYVLETIKRPIVFSGYEVGAALKVGKELNAHPKDTPLYVGYKWFSEQAPWMKADYQGEILDNSSFDQTAVMYASIGGVGRFWALSNPGTAKADAKGNITWTYSSTGHHRYLVLTENIVDTNTHIAKGMRHIPQ